ncbi:MAG: hypothetical protein ACTSQY_05705 [Candidatus Odinarchaeia archaeon]
MGLKRAIFYTLITLVATLSPSIADKVLNSYGVNFSSFALYEPIIISVAIIMAIATFIENFYLETKTVVSGVSGLVKHITYIVWTAFTFMALHSFLITYNDPTAGLVVIDLKIVYELVATFIIVGLVLKLIIYIWQIAFYKDIQKPKESEVPELKGKV